MGTIWQGDKCAYSGLLQVSSMYVSAPHPHQPSTAPAQHRPELYGCRAFASASLKTGYHHILYTAQFALKASNKNNQCAETHYKTAQVYPSQKIKIPFY